MLESQFHLHRDKPLRVAGPPGARARITAALEVFFPGASKNAWRFPFEVVEIEPGIPDEVLGFAVRTAEVVHYSGAPSTAVRLMQGGKTLSYSGDTEWTDALLPIADGADLFIVECYDYDRYLPGHTNFTTIMEKRALLKAKRIMVTHMNPTMLERQDEARAAGLIVAEDGLALDVWTRQPACLPGGPACGAPLGRLNWFAGRVSKNSSTSEVLTTSAYFAFMSHRLMAWLA